MTADSWISASIGQEKIHNAITESGRRRLQEYTSH